MEIEMRSVHYDFDSSKKVWRAPAATREINLWISFCLSFTTLFQTQINQKLIENQLVRNHFQ